MNAKHCCTGTRRLLYFIVVCIRYQHTLAQYCVVLSSIVVSCMILHKGYARELNTMMHGCSLGALG